MGMFITCRDTGEIQTWFSLEFNEFSSCLQDFVRVWKTPRVIIVIFSQWLYENTNVPNFILPVCKWH